MTRRFGFLVLCGLVGFWALSSSEAAADDAKPSVTGGERSDSPGFGEVGYVRRASVDLMSESAGGGTVVASGPPEAIVATPGSHTGACLREMLDTCAPDRPKARGSMGSE